MPRSTAEEERDCLEVSVTSCRSMSLVFGIFLIRVGIYPEGSVPIGTSNYRAPETKRARSTAGEGTRLSVNISYVLSIRVSMFRPFPIRVCINQGGPVSPGASDCRMAKAKQARPKAETGTRVSGNTSYFWSPHAISFRDFPDHCKRLPRRFCFA